jgi:hypothetical protein
MSYFFEKQNSTNNNYYVDASADYSTLGAYNNVSAQFITGPPVMSETKVQIIPSYGGVGFAGPNMPNSTQGGGTYAKLNSAYCCGTNACQTVSQPTFGNVVKQIYNKY